jgi:hypothetical protein
MLPDIDETPIHRLRLQPAAPRLGSRRLEPPARGAAPPEVWLYAALVLTLALLAASHLFALGHVR